MEKIGFGGGCHWCTEAVFQSLIGVEQVAQGWIASKGVHATFSEGVLVHYDPKSIDLLTLATIHLHTHSSTSLHAMRSKYRSAMYYFSQQQAAFLSNSLAIVQKDFERPIITSILPFVDFKKNQAQYLDYYLKNPDKPFCVNYIHPKLAYLKKKFSKQVSSRTNLS